MTQKVSIYLQALIDDDKLLANIESNIKNILSDNTIDLADIPAIMAIIIECSSNLGKFNLKYDEIPVVMNEFIKYIITHYNLIPTDKVDDIEKMIEMSIKLIMLQPKVKTFFSNLWNKIKNCCKKKN